MIRQFSVVDNRDEATAEDVPFLVVLQSHFLRTMDTVIVAPLIRPDVVQADGSITLSVQVDGDVYTLDTALLTHVDRRHLGRPRDDLTRYDLEIRRALDRLFTGF